MKLLLDTHTFIWWQSQSSKLSPNVFRLIENRNNTVFISLATIWEIQIKVQLGKLQLNIPLAEIVENQQNINNIQVLPITVNHIFALDNLPFYHKDPFDRILIAQAIAEDAILLTRDAIFAQYPVNISW
jgi:PIN domain nuclease of toxin-antitoxin system